VKKLAYLSPTAWAKDAYLALIFGYATAQPGAVTVLLGARDSWYHPASAAAFEITMGTRMNRVRGDSTIQDSARMPDKFLRPTPQRLDATWGGA